MKSLDEINDLTEKLRAYPEMYMFEKKIGNLYMYLYAYSSGSGDDMLQYFKRFTWWAKEQLIGDNLHFNDALVTFFMKKFDSEDLMFESFFKLWDEFRDKNSIISAKEHDSLVSVLKEHTIEPVLERIEACKTNKEHQH
jgi:hypothetical protein